jgi:glycogen debranching enzyme
MTPPTSTREWLEPDGLGGFASGTSTGIRTRRYHALLLYKATPAAIHGARREYLQPLLDHFEDAGLGNISEIADAEAPHTPRGCPWQAWSVGEALWLDRVVLAEPAQSTRAAKLARKSAPALVLATA